MSHIKRRKKILNKLTKQLIEDLKHDTHVYNEITIYCYLNRAYQSFQQTKHKAIKQRIKKSTKAVPVFQYNKFGSKVGTFDSYAQAQLYTGVKASAISDVINGKRTTAGKYYWVPQ